MTHDPTRTSHPAERTAVAGPPSGDMGLDELEADYELRGRDDLREFLSTRPEVVPFLRQLRVELEAPVRPVRVSLEVARLYDDGTREICVRARVAGSLDEAFARDADFFRSWWRAHMNDAGGVVVVLIRPERGAS